MKNKNSAFEQLSLEESLAQQPNQTDQAPEQLQTEKQKKTETKSEPKEEKRQEQDRRRRSFTLALAFFIADFCIR